MQFIYFLLGLALLLLVAGALIVVVVSVARTLGQGAGSPPGAAWNPLGFRGWVAGGAVALVMGVGLLAAAGVLGVPLALLTGGAVVLLWISLRRYDHAALSDAFALGIRRGVPLEVIAEAFGYARYSNLSRRARRFAYLIRQGHPPLRAIREAELPLSLSLQLQLDLGSEGRLEPADFEESDLLGEEAAVASRALIVPYFFWVLTVLSLVTVFISIMVAPTIAEMLEEFELDSGAALGFLSAGSMPGWLRPLQPAVLSFLFLTIVAYGCGWMLVRFEPFAWLDRFLPVVGPYHRSRRRSLVLSSLAVGAESGLELPAVIERVLEVDPRSSSSARLRETASYVERGMPWQQALVRSRLISQAEAPWLMAAEPSGRTGHALSQLALAVRRRATYRYLASISVAFPLLVLVLAIPVYLFATTLLRALYLLMESLA